MKLTSFAIISVFAATRLIAQDDASAQTLFTNVHVFDGVNEARIENASVLVVGNLIKTVSTDVINAPNATVIDGDGRTLMPGMMDMHVHVSSFGPIQTYNRDMLHPYAYGALAADRAEGMLLNGFTTVRDMGGAANYLRLIIDAGTVPGPRIYPSEQWITTTSGHGDFRELNDPHPSITGGRQHHFEQYGNIIADGRDEHLRAARETLRHGATQLKVFTSGGVTSLWDPLHSGPLDEEVRAVVDIADRWGTYVASHSFSPEAVKQAIDNGIRSIEHAPFLNDEIAQELIEKGIFLATAFSPVLDVPVEQAQSNYPPASFVKWKRVRDAAEELMQVLSRNPELKVVLGSDHIPTVIEGRIYDDKAIREFEYFSQALGNYQTLKAFTSVSAELNMMTGPMNPYTEGALGVVQDGSYADLLLVDGNPLEDITLMMDPDANLVVIMKDGVIFKNTLN